MSTSSLNAIRSGAQRVQYQGHLRYSTATHRPYSEFTSRAPPQVPILDERPKSEFSKGEIDGRAILSSMAAHTRSLSDRMTIREVNSGLDAQSQGNTSRRVQPGVPAQLRPDCAVVDKQPQGKPAPSVRPLHYIRRRRSASHPTVDRTRAATEGKHTRLKKRRGDVSVRSSGTEHEVRLGGSLPEVERGDHEYEKTHIVSML